MKQTYGQDTWFSTVYNAEILDLCAFFNIALTKQGQEYRGIEHDSLVITPKKNMYCWNSRSLRGKGGWSFIKNYVLNDSDNHLPQKELVSKMKCVGNQLTGKVSKFDEKRELNKVQPYVYPKKHIVANINAIKKYLVNERKIDPRLVSWLHATGLLDQDKMDNAVFVERDLFNQKIVGSVLQGTNINYQKFGKRGTSKMIDKNSEPYSAWHFTVGRPENVRFFESPIDAVSFFQLKRNSNTIFISMNGLKPEIVSKYLTLVDGLLGTKYKSSIKTIALCVDNDNAGSNFCQTQTRYQFTNIAGKTISISTDQPETIHGKDWNDVLKSNAKKKKF